MKPSKADARGLGLRLATNDTLLPVGPPPVNGRSVTGTVIPPLGNPAVRMLDTNGRANGRNWPGKDIPDPGRSAIRMLHADAWPNGRNEPGADIKNPAEAGPVCVN